MEKMTVPSKARVSKDTLRRYVRRSTRQSAKLERRVVSPGVTIPMSKVEHFLATREHDR